MYLKADGTIRPMPKKLKEVNKADGPDVSLLAIHVAYKELSCFPRLMIFKGSLQGKDPVKYAQEDSYKEKTSTPRKRGQPLLL